MGRGESNAMDESEHAMNDANAVGQGKAAAEEVLRRLELFAPSATNVQIQTVNQNPRRTEIIDYRADLPDGSAVYVPRIVFDPQGGRR